VDETSLSLNPEKPNLAASSLQNAMVPKAQFEALKQQLENQLRDQSTPASDETAPLQPDTEELLNQFYQDPVNFIRRVVNDSAEKYLTDLKEQAELHGALRIARQSNAEFGQFENFILQEVADIIQHDPDGVIAPWPDLLTQGYEQFKTKFQALVKQNPDWLLQHQDQSQLIVPEKTMENTGVRKTPEIPPTFTRQQIASMSPAEFLAQEAAIDRALKLNRIR